MTQEAHTIILTLCESIDKKVDGINDRLDRQNDRLRKCESAIGTMRFLVYSGGAGLVSVVGYLIWLHMLK